MLPRASLRYINHLNWARFFSNRPSSSLTTPLQDWSPPSHLLLLDDPFPVYRCCSCTALLGSTKKTAAFPSRGPDHCSRTCSLTHSQCRHNILVAQVTWLLRTCYPSAHPRTCYPSAHPRTCYASARYNLSYKTAPPLQSSLHHSLLPWSWLCWGGAASPGGFMPSQLDLFSCTTSYSCTVLVHHSILVHRSVISCTTRAPLRTLVHCPRAPLSCTTLMHHSRSNALSALLTYSRAPLNHS